jgi:hypothetical protein
MHAVIEWMAKLTSEFWFYISAIAIGLIAKISYMVYMKRTLTIFQWLAVIAMSICTGYITAAYCHAHGWVTEAQIAVPISTLLGEKLFLWIIQNHRQILDAGLGAIKGLSNGRKG